MLEDDLWDLNAKMPRRSTREALIYEAERLRLIVRSSPVRRDLNNWDSSMVHANEARIDKIAQFLSTVDRLVDAKQISTQDADDLIFDFHRTVIAAFEIGSVCYPSGSAQHYVKAVGAGKGRAVKVVRDNQRHDLQKALLQEVLDSEPGAVAGAPLRNPYKVAERLCGSPEALEKLNLIAKARDLPRFSKTTVERLLNGMKTSD